jgi:hypothetical protein
MLDNVAQIANRLDRFERYLDEIRTALVQMAKTEERVSIILEQNTELFKRTNQIMARLAEVEKINATQGQSLSFFERFGWLLVTAAAGVVGWMFK